MDSYTERLLERANARKKKLEGYYSEVNETPKIPLQEPNDILKKYENLAKSQPNLTESNRIKRKEVVSDSNLSMKSSNMYNSSIKENLSDSNLRKGCTRMSTDMPSSPQTPTKTLNIQKENFNMEIKLTSSDNVRVEVEIEEREEDFSDDDENYGDDENNVKGISKLQNGNDNDNCGEEVLKGIRRIQREKPKESDDKPVIREGVKNRLQRLGKLYSDDGELSSPIHRTESKFCEEEQSKKEIKKSTVGGRLKALASTRNQWEDELTTSCTKTTMKEVPKKSWKPPAPKPPAVTVPTFAHSPNKGRAPKPPATSSTLSTKVSTKVSSRESTPERTKIASPRNSPVKEGPTNTGIKQVAWDNAVLATLESQGFTRTNSNSKLVYNYEKQSESTKVDLDEIEEEEASNEEDNKKVSKLNVEITDTQVSEDDEEIESDEEGVEIPESKVCEPESKILKIASRFGEQRNLDVEDKKPMPKSPKTNLRTGDVLSRAAMFERSPNKAKDSKDPALMTVSERKALFEKNKGAALIPKAAFGMSAPLRINEKDTVASKPATVKPASPHKVQKSTIVSKLPALKKSTSPNKVSTESVMSPTKMYIAESGGIASKMKALLEKKSTISQNQIVNSIQEQRQKDLDLLLNRFNRNKHVPQENEIEEDESTDDESVTETTKMISDRAAKIVHFKEKDMPPPPAPPTIVTPPTKSSSAPKRRSKGDSPKVREVLEDVKRIKVIQPKSGRMYPCLSDIETCTETEQEDVPTTAEPSPDTSYDDENESFDSEDPNTSFGREILEVVCKSQTPQKRPILDESTASDLSDILDDMDDYLDEAMAREDSDCTEGPTPPKHGRSTPPRNVAAPSHSFHFSKGSPAKYGPPVLEPRSPIRQTAASPKSHARPTSTSNGNSYTPKKSIDLPTHVVDDGNVLPLTHTVSFYRKQQAQGSRTPVRQISRQPVVEESPEKDVPDETEEVREKIHELMNVVGKQQTVISQASQALNLCCSTIEFSGSSEQVEAERLLLVATQRRQAALHEVQRLRVEGTLHPGGGASVEKGTLVISDITLPLKKEYVRALSAAGGKGHHVVCLIRLAEHVIPTRLVSTVASPRDSPELNLRVPGSVRLENIYADFTVTVEVYSLQAQEEMLPHELKYHINTKKGGKMTPKKLLKQDSKLVMPSVQSPAGPQAVRSPSFALMGYVVFSLQGINRTHWTLNNAPAMSVLEGSVQMRVNCEMAVSVEHRGFLTMFEDVSGFGAWHRRWCLLKGHTLSYWKYPDDERKKTAIDTLNLQICSTKKVGQVSRDICARPHTFLLETVRTALPGDTDTLVTVCRGDKTLIRHLLSADTKQERVEWCEKFNKALDALRLWGGVEYDKIVQNGPKKVAMSTSIDSEAIREAYEDVRADNSSTLWAVFKFEGARIVCSAKGSEFPEFREQFSNGERAFGYIRLQTGDEMSKRQKFLLVTWVGPDVSVIQRAKMSTDKSLIKGIISNFAVELQLESLSEFELDHFTDALTRAGGANYGTGVRDL
ncbi:scraps [Carabus blaptoides fortunei]